MIDERSAGAIALLGGETHLLMIKDAFGRWTFPKGLLEEGETPREAALRELCEETGVSGRILSELGAVRYFYTRPDGDIVRKQVWWYLVQAENEQLRVQVEEIAAAEWVSPADAKERLAYRNMQPVLGRAMRAVQALGSRRTPASEAELAAEDAPVGDEDMPVRDARS